MAEQDVESLRKVHAEWSKGNFRPVTDVYGTDLEWGWSEGSPTSEGWSTRPPQEAGGLCAG